MKVVAFSRAVSEFPPARRVAVVEGAWSGPVAPPLALVPVHIVVPATLLMPALFSSWWKKEDTSIKLAAIALSYSFSSASCSCRFSMSNISFRDWMLTEVTSLVTCCYYWASLLLLVAVKCVSFPKTVDPWKISASSSSSSPSYWPQLAGWRSFRWSGCSKVNFRLISSRFVRSLTRKQTDSPYPLCKDSFEKFSGRCTLNVYMSFSKDLTACSFEANCSARMCSYGFFICAFNFAYSCCDKFFHLCWKSFLKRTSVLNSECVKNN